LWTIAQRLTHTISRLAIYLDEGWDKQTMGQNNGTNKQWGKQTIGQINKQTNIFGCAESAKIAFLVHKASGLGRRWKVKGRGEQPLFIKRE